MLKRDSPEGESIMAIRTKVSLPLEQNDHNDCGPLVVEMLMRTDQTQKADAFHLSQLQQGVHKEGNEGTLPGNICKFFYEQGYEVSYYTTIPWEKYQKNFGNNLENLPKEAVMFKPYIQDGFISAQKLQESANWLQKNEDIQKRQRLIYQDIAQFLQEGKYIIAIVGGDHYLVITGIDANTVYFNNPDFFITKENGERIYFDTREQSLSHADFEEWVTRSIHSTEAIVVSPHVEKRIDSPSKVRDTSEKVRAKLLPYIEW